MRLLFCGLLSACHAWGAAPHYIHSGALIERVADLMDRRLAVMPEVAAYKGRAHKPISDPVRERQVLEQSVADARSLHLDGAAARDFFAAQITMAKAVEEACIAQWSAKPEQTPVARDLVREIRPQLDAIDRQLLPAIYLASSAWAATPASELATHFQRLLRQPGATREQVAALAAALGRFRITAPPDWAVIRRVGVLRVGTTGDYAPFSSDQGGVLRGLDIDLARALAQAWGVSVEFVPTSWPALMSDLAQDHFDVAACGVSITAERKARVSFSLPYCFDGKMPIARRENAARFATLEQIDQPGVRVIVNPGGTNERFSREHFHRATIVLHADNRTIFDALVAGQADVMITDGIEVRLQARRHPELQPTFAEPVSRVGKGFLFAAGSELASRTDAWLGPLVRQGEIQRRLEKAVADGD